MSTMKIINKEADPALAGLSTQKLAAPEDVARALENGVATLTEPAVSPLGLTAALEACQLGEAGSLCGAFYGGRGPAETCSPG